MIDSTKVVAEIFRCINKLSAWRFVFIGVFVILGIFLWQLPDVLAEIDV